jgi:hypothetical protein
MLLFRLPPHRDDIFAIEDFHIITPPTIIIDDVTRLPPLRDDVTFRCRFLLFAFIHYVRATIYVVVRNDERQRTIAGQQRWQNPRNQTRGGTGQNKGNAICSRKTDKPRETPAGLYRIQNRTEQKRFQRGNVRIHQNKGWRMRRCGRGQAESAPREPRRISDPPAAPLPRGQAKAPAVGERDADVVP